MHTNERMHKPTRLIIIHSLFCSVFVKSAVSISPDSSVHILPMCPSSDLSLCMLLQQTSKWYRSFYPWTTLYKHIYQSFRDVTLTSSRSLNLDRLLNRLFRHRSKNMSKLRATGLYEGNPPVAGGFPSDRASNAENVSIWWRHHEDDTIWSKLNSYLVFKRYPFLVFYSIMQIPCNITDGYGFVTPGKITLIRYLLLWTEINM